MKQEGKVVQYYSDVDSSLQNWGNKEVYECHYGYKDAPTQNHSMSLIRMNEVVAEAARVKEGDTILDAGCGVGATSIWLARQFSAKVHGVTLSQLQVKKARDFAAKHHVEHLANFSLENYLKTQFPDNYFDVVWAQESTCHTYHKAAFLSEAYRILKPGGRVVVVDYFLTKEEMSETEEYAIDKWCDGWALASLPSIEEFKGYLKDCGYDDLRIADNTKYIEESAQIMFVRGKEGYPDDLLTKAKTIVRIKHTEANMFQKIALDMGLWKHLIFMGQKQSGKQPLPLAG
jgi:cyclopropane fatty-acyl-phospholipid synthase-like methyltransferase